MKEYDSVKGYPPEGALDQKRTPRIPELLKKNASLISRLHEIICTLDAKLQPVLRLEPATPTSPGGKSEEMPRSPMLTDILDAHGRDIDFSIQRIEKLISLLEI